MFLPFTPSSNAGPPAAEPRIKGGPSSTKTTTQNRSSAVLEFPQIRDIAPPVEPSSAIMLPWMWWAAAAVLAVLLLAGLFFWLRSLGRGIALPGLPARPDKLAAQALETLRQAAPQLGAEEFAARLSEIVRTFLHRQTGVLARYATSPEILGDRPRPDQPPPPPVIAAFREVLTAGDALKYGPPVADRAVQTDALIDSALAAVKAAATVEVILPITPPPLPQGPTTAADEADSNSPAKSDEPGS